MSQSSKRLIPDRHAHRGGDGRSVGDLISGAERASTARCAKKEKSVSRTSSRSAGPIPRTATPMDARSGIFRLRRPGRRRPSRAGCEWRQEICTRWPQGGTAVGTGLNSKPENSPGCLQNTLPKSQTTALHQAPPTSSKALGFPRRLRVRARARSTRWRPACSRSRTISALLGSGPRFRIGRVDSLPENRAGLLDHGRARSTRRSARP